MADSHGGMTTPVEKMAVLFGEIANPLGKIANLAGGMASKACKIVRIVDWMTTPVGEIAISDLRLAFRRMVVSASLK